MLQIYLLKSDEINRHIWSRAKKAGFKALLLTTDTQLLGKREPDTRLKLSLPKSLGMKIYEPYQDQSSDATSPEAGKKESGLAEYVK